MTDTSRRNRRLLIALTSALAAAAIVLPVLGVLLAPGILNKQQQDSSMITTTTTPPVLTIKPLALRPVLGAFVTTPEECVPPPPTPPEAPMHTCDILKSAVYDLGPEQLRLQLTDVDSFLNPLTNKQVVQVTMKGESARAFTDYTAAHIGQQVAFVRGGVVVWAPKITEKIDGEVLQLSGDVTAERAGEIARMLRDEA